MKKRLGMALSALALGGMILATSAPADAHGFHGRGHGWGGAAIADAILGGLASGALAAPPYYYPPPAYYPPPVYYPPLVYYPPPVPLYR